jgi:hypothetical protein
VLVGILAVVLAGAQVRIGRFAGILFVAAWCLGVLGWVRTFRASRQLRRRFRLSAGTAPSRAVVRSAYRDVWRRR